MRGVSSPVSHDHSAIFQSLSWCVVSLVRIITVARLKYGELFLDVLSDGQEYGDGRHEHIANEGLHQVGKDGSQAGVEFSISVYGEIGQTDIKPKAI